MEGAAPYVQDASKSPAAILLDTPAHSLPPVRLLWRELMGVGVAPAVHNAAAGEGGKAGASGAADGADDVDQARIRGHDGADAFSPTPLDALSSIFGARLGLGA